MNPHYPKLGIAAIAGLLAVSACKKDKDNKPGKPDYLVSAIYEDGMPLDSFTYNDKRQVAQMYYEGTNARFEYDAGGRCVRVKYYQTGDGLLVGKDTLVYNNRDFTVYTEDDDDPFEIENGHPFKVGNDGIALAGSKDTMVSLTDRKRVNYVETIYSGGNPLSITIVDYLAIPTSGYVSSKTTTLTYEYDNKPNGLQWLFKHNPYAGYLLTNVVTPIPVFPGGRHNLKKLKYEQVTTSYTDRFDYAFVNAYDPASGFVASQEIRQDDDVEVTYTYHYRAAE